MRPNNVPISASDSGGGLSNAWFTSLQLMIARSTSSFFGTWKTVVQPRWHRFVDVFTIPASFSASTVARAAEPLILRGGTSEWTVLNVLGSKIDVGRRGKPLS